MLCMGLAFMPWAAIIDYELTLSAPARVTADTGIDALTHGIEAYVSQKASPFSDQQALAAIALLAPNLRRVYHDPEDREAREAMMWILPSGYCVLQRLSGAGAWHESAYWCAFSYSSRSQQCHVVAGGDALFDTWRPGALRPVRTDDGCGRA